MKVKEINRTANIAWSPKDQHPIYLAAGTAAQQLDASFSTAAALEIYHVDLKSKDLEMPVAGSMPCNHRFNRLMWGNFQGTEDEHPAGLIIGGTDSGDVCVFDAASILDPNQQDKEDALLFELDDHTGAVTALDINKHQSNLLATGASDSEIFIWDLRNLETPLTPGAKSTPPDQVSCLAWNQQVQHILASSSNTGRVVVWDLRKSEPIIKVGDQSAMFNYKSIAWHPDVATQMLIGNEDDRYPCIQMWDLRFATSPVKLFEGHSRGVLSLAWCPMDSDLVMSVGKDNRILTWDPNSSAQKGEIVFELSTTSQWTSDVRWCPRNPTLVSTTSFDGHVTVSSLMGGTQTLSQESTSREKHNSISEAFGVGFATTPDSPMKELEVTTQFIEPLRKPPKWMRKPCGARFSFGGKLVSFDCAGTPNEPKQVHLSQVITENDFLSRSGSLENALLTGQLVDFCDTKIAMATTSQSDRSLWRFLRSNFSAEPRVQHLELLGYSPQEIAKKISSLTAAKEVPIVTATDASGSTESISSAGFDAQELANKMQLLDAQDTSKENSGWDWSETGSPIAGEKTPLSDTEGAAIFDAIAATTEEGDSSTKVENAETEEPAEAVPIEKVVPLVISTDDGTDGLICQALLTGNFQAAVDVCFRDGRPSDGLVLAIAGGSELFTRTQKRYLDGETSTVAKVISAVVNRDWRRIVESCVIENWKEALASLVTYSKQEEFSELACLLGARLESEVSDFTSALVCYVCAGSVDRLVSCWVQSMTAAASEATDPLALQDLIEKVMLLKRAVERDTGPNFMLGGDVMAAQLSNYASILASQGNLQTAMVYLSTISDQAVSVLKDRIFQSAGNVQPAPFNKIEIQAAHIAQPPQAFAATPQPSTPQPFSFNNSAPVPSRASQQAPLPRPVTNAVFQPPTAFQSPVLPPSSAPQPPPSGQFISSSPHHYNPGGGGGAQPGMYTPPDSQEIYPAPGSQPNGAPAGSASQPYMFQPPSGPFNQPPGRPPMGGPPMGAPPMGAPAPGQPAPPRMMSQPPPTSNQPSPGMFSPPSIGGQHGTNTPPPMMFNPGQPTHSNTMQPATGFQSPPPHGLPPPSSMGPPPSSSMGLPPPSSMGPPMIPEPLQEPNTAVSQAPMSFYNPATAGGIPAVEPAAPGQFSTGGSSSYLTPHAASAPSQPTKVSPMIEEVAKKPLSSEQAALQQIFDELVDKCKNTSSNPQSKRKLEDVRRKLSILYDLLRENKISPNVLAGLQQMSQSCQGRDYSGGIQVHTRMITTGNFSEISSFMPGLKTLMQIANQLKI